MEEINPEKPYHTPLLVVITGPTAVGKTALAIALAKYFQTEIVSADSRQFYREMKIGTAVPSEAELSAVVHHFIGTHSITDSYNVYQFESDTHACLQQLFTKRGIVFMCGGSGLYVHAISDGIDLLPDTGPEVREDLTRQYREYGLAYLLQQLRILDPNYYTEVDLKNPVRIIRALEVCLVTGKPFSSFRLQEQRPKNYNVLKIALSMTREDLFNRIDQRVEEMIQAGMVGEAVRLIEHRNVQALNTVGYKELFDYLDGNCTKDDAIEKIKVNTRRYAKKQMTWLKKQNNYIWFHPKQKEGILRLIENALNT